ncbi:MAG TPA: YceI family protein [Casimicrobiaceae bacterium]|nr:YceI family protein [Casimicrobiaceae bacterium]
MANPDFHAARALTQFDHNSRASHPRSLVGAARRLHRAAAKRQGRQAIVAIIVTTQLGTAWSAQITYKIDPEHTFPSFEATHQGLSIWRGRFDRTRGTIKLDQTAAAGTVDVTVDTRSVDFGLDTMNEVAKSGDWLDVGRYPEAFYRGQLATFVNGAPTEVTGNFTLRGVTKPLNLKINSFKCLIDDQLKRKICGADASGQISRVDFGVNPDKRADSDMNVTLRIQIEAIEAD